MIFFIYWNINSSFFSKGLWIDIVYFFLQYRFQNTFYCSRIHKCSFLFRNFSIIVNCNICNWGLFNLEINFPELFSKIYERLYYKEFFSSYWRKINCCFHYFATKSVQNLSDYLCSNISLSLISCCTYVRRSNCIFKFIKYTFRTWFYSMYIISKTCNFTVFKTFCHHFFIEKTSTCCIYKSYSIS